MKKIKLEFQKEVISTLSGNELSQIQGGNTAFSYNSCPTVDGPCTASSECTDQDSWQGKCLSDNYPDRGGYVQPRLPIIPCSGATCHLCIPIDIQTEINCIEKH